MVDLSFFITYFILFLSVLGTLFAITSVILKDSRFLHISIFCLSLFSILIVIISINLWYLLFSRDFSCNYVFKTSHASLSYFYTFTTFWSAKEGSHLLWTLFISIISSLMVLRHVRIQHLIFYLNLFAHMIMFFMVGLLTLFHNPFEVISPTPLEGLGLNPILQNFYMSLHPPFLFLGYATLVIPFYYIMSSILHGSWTKEIAQKMLFWTMCSWTLLSIGILLGSRWAYLELGWGGYWSWDPVETLSLLPWLLLLATGHFLCVQLRSKQQLWHPQLTAVICFVAVFSTFFSSFLIKTGVLHSVHAYAKSSLKPSYVFYTSLCLTVFLLLFSIALITRKKSAPKTSHNYEPLKIPLQTKATLGGVFLFIVFFVIILLSLFTPPLTKLFLGQAIILGPSFFGATLPWLTLPLLISMIISFFYIFRSLFSNAFLIILPKLLGHLGFILFTLGTLGSFLNEQEEFDLALHEVKTTQNHTLSFDDYAMSSDLSGRMISAYISIKNIADHGPGSTLFPALRHFSFHNIILSRPDILVTPNQDIYLTLMDINTADVKHAKAHFRLALHPFISLVWLGGILIIFGGCTLLLCFWRRRP